MRWLAMLLLGIALLLGWTDGRGRLESAAIDQLASLNGRPAPDDILIVAIDEPSLAALGRWPWRRTVHAALLDRLAQAGVRGVGLDVILSEPDREHPQDDALLAEAMRAGPPVVLPVIMAMGPSGAPQAAGPVPVLAASAKALGHIHVELDADGVARSVFLKEGGPGRWWDHFALALLGVAGQSPSAADLPGQRRPPKAGSGWLRDHWMQIPYAGPPGHFRSVSYVDVLEGRVPAAMLRGQLALVGATAVGLGDAYPTPMASHDALMPGVEVSANVADSLRQGLTLRRAESWENAAVAVLMTGLLLLGLRRLSPWQGLCLVVAAMAATAGLTWLALRLAGVQLSPLPLLGALALVYPLWSWRRLEAARLQEALRREQEAVWRFIAHDMRAPQSAIVALVRRWRASGEALDGELMSRVEAHAQRSLTLADDHVQLARARHGGAQEPLDLRDVVADAVDQQWPLAEAQSVRLTCELPDDEAVVRGDRALLVRALVNLLSNALRFTPEGGTVRCALSPQGQDWEMRVSDEGPGVPPELRPRLFQPFAQAMAVANEPDRAAVQAASGAGLGLVFVRTVAERHGGRADLDSGPRTSADLGAAFFIRLPRA
ncbi:CHASE2 and HATPase_c domain-containing protein [Aquabacterium sp. CECT 9606]|uniref:CHASE2 and HATPase_c domain-containing protein n=1 Tax=Aquabacterium sp. CECT 9606 TaxID=2845822 RepID=UPI001E2C0F9C|nr:CHASE2 and HATPase_c domain-containing protein [Aquabacterium sp. CECT 9606]